LMEEVPCEKLPMVLEGLIPYHTREKMHRVRGSGAKKPAAAKEPATTHAA
jgi:ferredoxin-nitrite reductase